MEHICIPKVTKTDLNWLLKSQIPGGALTLPGIHFAREHTVDTITPFISHGVATNVASIASQSTFATSTPAMSQNSVSQNGIFEKSRSGFCAHRNVVANLRVIIPA